MRNYPKAQQQQQQQTPAKNKMNNNNPQQQLTIKCQDNIINTFTMLLKTEVQ